MHHLEVAGFSNLEWRIETLAFSGEKLKAEIKLNQDRLDGALAFFEGFLGTKDQALRFREEYLLGMQKPNAVLFYNKFIVSAQKSGLKRQGAMK